METIVAYRGLQYRITIGNWKSAVSNVSFTRVL